MNYASFHELKNTIFQHMMQTEKKQREEKMFRELASIGKCLCGGTTFGMLAPCRPVREYIERQIEKEAFVKAKQQWRDLQSMNTVE